jgi:hypothetical protein
VIEIGAQPLVSRAPNSFEIAAMGCLEMWVGFQIISSLFLPIENRNHTFLSVDCHHESLLPASTL